MAENLTRVLGEEKQKELMEGAEALALENNVLDKFQWVSNFMQKMDLLVTPEDRYDIISKCAHVFPTDLIEKAHQVFIKDYTPTKDILSAVDAALRYMETSSGWGTVPIRKGSDLYTTKNPRDPEGFKNAHTQAEKIESYCYCPLIRNYLEQGMSPTFCNCGAGWVRQQWEGIIGHPLKIELAHSLLKGDEKCEFIIHIPASLE